MTSAAALRMSLSTARATLEDLQAEIEAGDRYASRIQTDAGSIDARAATHPRFAARCGALRQCVAELRASISQQRTILRDLRGAISRMRREMQKRPR